MIFSSLSSIYHPFLAQDRFRFFYCFLQNSRYIYIYIYIYQYIMFRSGIMLLLLVLVVFGATPRIMAAAAAESNSEYTLDSVRKALERQEDTIIFNLIHRAKFPLNSHTYDQHYMHISFPRSPASLLDFLVTNTEAIQAKAGRYKSPEENPFFPEYLPQSLVPDYPFSKILHPGAASVSINKSIWALYFQQLLPLLVASGDDGNYAQTAAADLSLLQAISTRIHYGKFVAEIKFRESPQDYDPLVRAQDKEGLMKLLTSERVEEMVKKRVQKKAMVFGQNVSLERDDDDDKPDYKLNPSLVYRLYDKWVIPLTKEVEVQYLLRRLD